MPRLDRLDARYRDHHGDRQELVFGGDERASRIRALVGGPGLRVLEVGCRTGALTQSYAAGNEVVGVDVDRAALAAAEERLGIETHWSDVEESLPFEDETFDVVVVAEVLEHLADPAGALENVRRVLKQGGRLVGSVPNAYRLKNRLIFLAGGPPDNDPMHLQLFSTDALRSLLHEFEDVRIEFAVGRFVRLHPRLLANTQVFSARKPG